MRDLGPRLLLFGATLLLIGGLAELGYRTWLHRLASEEQFRTYASVAELEASGFFSKFVRHRYLGYVPAPNYRKGANAHDALGFRGEGFPLEKPAGEFRIVALGGSTTYTNGVQDYRGSYPHQLERELHERGFRNVRVINAGVPGYASWESLVSLQFRVLDLDPDMILIYHAVNDAINRVIWPPAAYRGDNSGIYGPTDPPGSAPPWYERSVFVRVLRIWLGLSPSPGALERSFSMPLKTAHGLRYVDQVRAGRYPAGIFRRVPPDTMFQRNPPRYFRRNMESIVALARAHGVEPVLVSFAYSELKTDDAFVSEPFRFAIDQQNALTAAIARRHGTPFFDFAAVFPKTPDLWIGGLHLNRRGAELKARYFADFLVSSGGMDPRRGR